MAAENAEMISPPRWAEGLLQASLAPDDFECVAGDLLEHYRERVHPERGRAAAQRWYLRQVLGFVWRGARLWAALLACGFLLRTAMDWRLPTTDFHVRSATSTWIAIGTLLLAGIVAARRSGRVRSGTLFAAASAGFAALLCSLGWALFLSIWHDPTTLSAIRGSGGISEVLVLPFLVIIPAWVVGTAGGCIGFFLSPRRGA